MMEDFANALIFSSGSILEFRRTIEENMKREIEYLRDDDALKFDTAQIKAMANKYLIASIKCEWDKVKPEIIMRERQANISLGEMSRTGIVRKAVVKYTIPYTGSNAALKFKPTQFTISPLDVVINYDFLEFSIWSSSGTEDLSDEIADTVRREKEIILGRLKTEIERLNSDIASINSGLMNLVSSLIKEKAERIVRKRELERNL